MSEGRLHNKSNKQFISVFYLSDEEAEFHYKEAMKRLEGPAIGNCMGHDSPCRPTKHKGGRYIPTGFKNQLCYTYQLVARKSFGNEPIVASKTNDDMTISHLCGFEESRCAEECHLIIEPKRVNDERVHCHFIMNSIVKEWKMKKNFKQELKYRLKDFADKYCPHTPKCGSINNEEN